MFREVLRDVRFATSQHRIGRLPKTLRWALEHNPIVQDQIRGPDLVVDYGLRPVPAIELDCEPQLDRVAELERRALLIGDVELVCAKG